MKSPLLLLALALAPAMHVPAQAGAFFAAHQDDIVLLMGGSAYRDIQANNSTVLVVVTAGDASNGSAPGSIAGLGRLYFNQMGNPYYRVRHNAHEAAIAVWVPRALSTIPQRSTEYFSPVIAAVEKVRIGNVTLYNLNLPDGFLERFYAGDITDLVDVTGTNRYTPESLRQTLHQILARNSQDHAGRVINLPEHTPAFSAPGYNDAGEVAAHGDHSDHIATGRFVRDTLAAPGYACVRRAVYMGYGISATADSMSAIEKLAQAQAYTALNTVLRNQGNVSYNFSTKSLQLGSLDLFHLGFFGKQRWRDDGAKCAEAAAAQASGEKRTSGRLQR